MPTLNTKFKKKPSGRKWLFILNCERKGSEINWECALIRQCRRCFLLFYIFGLRWRQKKTNSPKL